LDNKITFLILPSFLIVLGVTIWLGFSTVFGFVATGFEKINVDNKRDEASKYGVRSIPTIIIEKDGNVKERFTGLQEKKVLKSALSKLL